MLTHTQVIGSREEKISTLSYDPLGVLIQKKVGGLTGNLQTVDFTYNIRGWMTHMNKDTADDDLFFYELNYNKDSFVPLYNGNISSNKYFTKQDYVLRGYNYYYDHLNRLVNALSIKKYGRSILEDNLYDESLSYDKNGNILTLNRNTNLSNLPHEIDNLTYEYQGNQLLKVSDSSGSPSGFKDGTNTGNDYSYDTFGNIKQDLNKNLTNITYNHLNLPVEITFANGSKINYTYDAAGTRKSKRVQPTSGAVVTTDYMNEFQYENSELQFIRHPEGYVKHNGSGQFMYVYQYKDHLGNVRLSYADIDGSETIDSASEILEENNYYPFGLKHQGYNEIANSNRSEAAEKYKYGGKEWNDELGLDWYDFHARNYDPAIGRWLNVDPLAEETMEPYLYTGNNPIMFTDPTGMSKEGGEDFIYNKKEGTYHWDSNVSSPEDVCDDNIEYVGPNTEDVNKHHQKNNPFLSNFTTPKFGEDLNGRWQGEVKTHTPGFWENQSNGNIFQRSLYDLSNSFYTTYQLFIGRTVGNLTMRNLDGSSTSTEQGALGLYGVSATFTGGRFIASGAKYLSNLKLMYEPINLGKNGFVNFRIGIRNTRTNYQLRLERHQFNTNTGTKIHSTHINYGNNGKQHLLLNPKKAKKIKL